MYERTQNKSERGITLIALIITIIIMIILAAVSIKEIVGENSIITAAEKAATDYVEAEKEEQNILQNIFDQAENFSTKTKEQTMADLITPANYGDSVDYSAGGVSDWKIFYNDGVNVFLISSDIVSISDETATALGVTRNGDYAIYWADEADLEYTGSEDIDPKVADKYMLSWYEAYPTCTNDNAKLTAALMDTDIWNLYVNNEYAVNAIGAPSIEMFLSVYKALGGSRSVEFEIEETGYTVKVDGVTDRVFTLELEDMDRSKFSIFR